MVNDHRSTSDAYGFASALSLLRALPLLYLDLSVSASELTPASFFDLSAPT